MKNSTKEFKILNNDLINVKIGTVNRINPQVFYIFAKGWTMPTFSSNNYKNDIDLILHSFKMQIRKFLIDNNFPIKHIFNFDMAFDKIEKDSFTYFTIEIVIKQSKDVLDMKKLKEILNDNIIALFCDFIDNMSNNGFVLKQKR